MHYTPYILICQHLFLNVFTYNFVGNKTHEMWVDSDAHGQMLWTPSLIGRSLSLTSAAMSTEKASGKSSRNYQRAAITIRLNICLRFSENNACADMCGIYSHKDNHNPAICLSEAFIGFHSAHAQSCLYSHSCIFSKIHKQICVLSKLAVQTVC